MEGKMTKETGEYGGFFTDAEKVSLEEVLAFREEKAKKQETLLARHAVPLLCLGLNIPGEYKRFPLAARSFEEEMRIVRLSLAVEQIAVMHEERFEAGGGYAAFIAANAPPEKLKKIAGGIEDRHPLGRLFDIDVLRQDGGKVSRREISRRDHGAETRRCLICGGDAFVCGRSRVHSAGELQNAVLRIMARFQRSRLADMVAAAALRALIGEAAITPKPGLVDRANNGAHRDMHFFSFIDSTAAIIPYFRHCALAGFDAADERPEAMMRLSPDLPGHPSALFNRLRPAGKIAELAMLAASGGANTHRGLIFSIGLASAAFGAFFRCREQLTPDDALDFIASMTRNITNDFGGPDGHGEISHGEAVYKRYGIGGVREEARRGFPAIRNYALPALRRALQAGLSLNDAGIAAFLHLLSAVMDTNIIHRSDAETLEAIRRNAADFLASNPGPAAMAEYAAKLDRDFIAKNISPGGCADLLALTLFLHWLCG
jgi:holo-ACP synthase/triphosphoribosyl-dephospho-CoA synthase